MPEQTQTALVQNRYLCKPRNLRFTDQDVERSISVGSRCYQGSAGDICSANGAYCGVLRAYEEAHAQSSASCTSETLRKVIRSQEFFL